MIRALFVSAALTLAPPAGAAPAQTSPAVQAAAPDPARLAASQALLARILPPAQREAMIDQIVRPMMDNLRASMVDSPMFKDSEGDPRLTGILTKFLDDTLEESIATTKESLPAMFDAMARAYARRFTLDELAAIGAFFDTPAGQAYVAKAPTIMADPDILAAQRAMMTKAMANMQTRLAALSAKVAEEKQKEK